MTTERFTPPYEGADHVQAEVPGRFGFRVTVHPESRWNDGVPGVPVYAVTLPHQCDRWEVTGADQDGLPKGEARACLEQFIAEANDALAVLEKAP
jgi:hypothetical protein